MAQYTLEELFARYRRDGAPAPLAEVFDRTAPELLRVACHVAGDLAAAEDLLQTTFVTAIESAGAWDERRPLLPWLLGILANHARAARRKETRDAERADARAHELRVLHPLPRAEPTPLAHAQGRELDARVGRELDRLAEPYRAVAILTLRHELTPAQIAIALGRSPGAVRVQLHRALEQLRTRLPRSAALPALFAASLGRGIASIRAVVLKSAATQAAAAAALVTVGSLLVTKKLVAAVVVTVAAATVLWQAIPERDARRSASQPAEPRATAAAAPTAPSPASVGTAERESSAPVAVREAEELGALPSRPPTAVALQGTVVDGNTLLPITGATIDYFEPLRMRLSDVRSRFAAYSHPDSRDGLPRFDGGWPRLIEPLPEGAWWDATDVELCAPPASGVAALAKATSGSDGAFELAATLPRGVLLAAHVGYESRVVPVVAADASVSIRLFPTRPIRGVVVDGGGAPVGGLELLLLAWDARIRVKGERQPLPIGPWLVPVAADGTFELEAGAPSIVARSATAGFEVVEINANASGDRSLRIQVRRLAVLTVLDAATQRPIEDFSILSTSMNSGSPVYAGRLHARGGRVQFEAAQARSGNAIYPAQEAAWIDVWNDDHVPARVVMKPANERVDVTVELTKGRPPELAGRLVRGGAPIARTTLSLNAFYPLGWSEQSLHKIDETSTDDDGAFSLRGPPGRFVLFVPVGERPLMRIVALPTAGSFVLDVESGGRIDVVVRDARGAPRPDAKVAIRGPNSKQEMTLTDASGHALFEALVAGEYVVSLNGTREVHVAIPQDLKNVQVSDGAVVSTELTAPPAGPVHLRIHAEGTSDYSGWKARDGTYVGSEWSELTVDGVFGADAVNFTFFNVAAPDGTAWSLHLTPQVLADGVVELPVNDIGYRGRVLDRATGAPLANAAVQAALPGSEETVTARADADGRFVLKNLRPVTCVLTVRRVAAPSRDRRRDAEDDGQRSGWFRPAQPAAPGGREITLRVPQISGAAMSGTERRVFTGRIARKSGAPVANASIYFQSKFVEDDGEWAVGVEGSLARSGNDGSYRVVAARAPAYAFSAYESVGGSSRQVTAETWSDDGRESETIEHDVVADE